MYYVGISYFILNITARTNGFILEPSSFRAMNFVVYIRNYVVNIVNIIYKLKERTLLLSISMYDNNIRMVVYVEKKFSQAC